jgi:hypothetical protein
MPEPQEDGASDSEKSQSEDAVEASKNGNEDETPAKSAESAESAENGNESSEQEGEKSGRNADSSDQDSASDEDNTRDNGGSRDDEDTGRGKEDTAGDSTTQEAMKDREIVANGKSSVSKDDASDSDDAPIVPKKNIQAKAPETKKEIDSDDEPLAPKRKLPPPRQPNDEDSDDDKPIKPKAAAVPSKRISDAGSAKSKKKPAKQSSSDEDESSSSSEQEERTSKRRKPTAGSAVSKSSAAPTNKDWLVERYLVRWWYHEDWPPKHRPVADVPDGYKEMEHYPYMYINDAGHVLNKRTPENMPPCKQVSARPPAFAYAHPASPPACRPSPPSRRGSAQLLMRCLPPRARRAAADEAQGERGPHHGALRHREAERGARADGPARRRGAGALAVVGGVAQRRRAQLRRAGGDAARAGGGETLR